MLKLVSKGLNVGAEVLRYQGLCFFIWAFWKWSPIRALGYLLFLIMVARWMLVTNTAGQSVATTFLFIALLAMFPLSSVLSMYSFATGSITRPALALALGTHFRKAD